MRSQTSTLSFRPHPIFSNPRLATSNIFWARSDWCSYIGLVLEARGLTCEIRYVDKRFSLTLRQVHIVSLDGLETTGLCPFIIFICATILLPSSHAGQEGLVPPPEVQPFLLRLAALFSRDLECLTAFSRSNLRHSKPTAAPSRSMKNAYQHGVPDQALLLLERSILRRGQTMTVRVYFPLADVLPAFPCRRGP